MKDSNAAPSSNAPAPKAEAHVASENVTPKKAVAPAVAQTPAATKIAAVEPKPRVEVSSSETPKVEAQSPTVTPEIPFPEVLTPKVTPQKVTPQKTTMAKTPLPKTVAPKVAVASIAATATKAGVAGGAKTKSVAPVAAPKRTLPKFRPLYVFAALAALILTTAGGVAVGSYNNWSNSQIIAPKVRVAGEPIGGMTREQAVAHLNTRFAKLAFTLQTDDKPIVLGLADVGGKPSIGPTVDKAFAIGRDGNLVNNFTRVFGAEVKPHTFGLPIEWNRGALTSRLKIVNKQYARPAVDARLVTVSGDVPRVTGEASGRVLDVSATADAIQKSYYLGLGKVEAVARAVEPKITSADLEGQDVKLGFYRTTYNNGIAGRTTNIHVACRAIDGTVLMPGEVLSFNGLTGERTYRKGYRMAHVFMREPGQTESSVVDGLAGGVCQVSSTLYNAVRKTNAQFAGKPLGIVERSSHSLPVTYVPAGRDATVAWPSRDFKFRNDQNFPVYVRTDANDGRLTISIWGRVPQNQAVPVSLDN